MRTKNSLLGMFRGGVILVREELMCLTGGKRQAAMLLSQMIYWQEQMGEGAWWYKTNDDWAGELMMRLSELKAAKEVVRQLDFVEVRVRGIPAKTFYRLNEDALRAAIAAVHQAWQGRKKGWSEQASQLAESDQLCVGNRPTNTENTQKITTEKFSFGKQRVPRKAADILPATRESVDEIVAEFEGKTPTPNTADRCFRKLWAHARTGRPLVAATNKRLAMLGKTASLIGSKWPEVFAATLTRWDEFCGQVAADTGATRCPSVPSVEFMLQHVGVMVAMGQEREPAPPTVVKVIGPRHRQA